VVRPRSASGIVERTVPSARMRWGLVKTSSVGMFATCSMPFETSEAACHSLSACSPIVRSVPGPLRWSESKRRSVIRSALATIVFIRSRQASTGSSESRRSTWTI